MGVSLDTDRKMDDENCDFQICTICYEDYDTDEHIPCIGTCGHTVCNLCRTSMLTSRCPHCNRKEAFVVKNVNGQLIDLIRCFNRCVRRTTIEKKKPSNKGNCVNCFENSGRLRICLDCSMKSGMLNDRLKMDDTDNVQEVSRRLKGVALCGDCVLDEGHCSHKTIPLPNGFANYQRFLNDNNDSL